MHPIFRRLTRLLPVVLLLCPAAAQAHPADEAAVYHYLWMEIGPRQVELQHALLPGGRISPAFWAEVDTDGDGLLSAAEKRRHAHLLLSRLNLRIDGKSRSWRLKRHEYPDSAATPPRDLPAIRLQLVHPLQTAVGERVQVEAGDSSARNWTGIFPEPVIRLDGLAERRRVVAGDGRLISLDLLREAQRLDRPRALKALRLQDDRPAAEKSTDMAGGGESRLEDDRPLGAGGLFSRGGPLYSRSGHEEGDGHDHPSGGLRALLSDRVTPGIAIFGLLAALALGAMHALTPGHGRGLVAATLVGSRGTIADALLLGISTTITHMAITFALAVVTLLLTARLETELVNRWLSIFSGLLVLGAGFWMLQNGLLVWYGVKPLAHTHCFAGHTHIDAEESDPEEIAVAPSHNHDGIACTGHHHTPPPAAAGQGAAADPRRPCSDHPLEDAASPSRDRLRSSAVETIVLGISSGIIPCLDAMAVLVAAVNLRQVAFGLALVGAFSLGMAVVLCGTGIALVTARRRFGRLGSEAAWARAIPAVSGGLLFIFGGWLTLRSLIDAGIIRLGG